MWERYCRGVNAIVWVSSSSIVPSPSSISYQSRLSNSLSSFVLDSADASKVPAAKTELTTLLEKPILTGIPVLVLGNKNDLPGALTADQIIEQLGLKSITGREVACYSISAKNHVNIDLTLQVGLRAGLCPL